MSEPPITRRQQSLGFFRGLPPAAAPAPTPERALRDAQDEIRAQANRIRQLEGALKSAGLILVPFLREPRR